MPCTSARRHAGLAVRLMLVGAAILLTGSGVAWSAVPPGAAAAEPVAKAAERDPRLDQRDRLEAEAEQLEREGAFAQAIEKVLAQLALEQEVFGATHVEVAGSYDWLARLYTSTGDFTKARRYADENVAQADQLFGREGWRLAEARRRRALIDRIERLDAAERERLVETSRQSELLEAEGNYAAALDQARQRHEILAQRLGEDDYFTLVALRRVAELSIYAGEFEQVEQQLRGCVRSLERAVGREHPMVADCFDTLAGYYRSREEYEEAASYYRQSAELLREIYGPDHAQTGVGWNNLAVAYEELGLTDKAVPLYRESLRIAELRYGANHDEVRITRDNLARVLAELGFAAIDADRWDEARKSFLESTALRAALYGETDWRTVDSRINVQRVERLSRLTDEQRRQFHAAEALLKQADELGDAGQATEALAAAQKALALFRALFGDTDRAVPTCLNEIAVHLTSLERYDEALQNYQQAALLFRPLLGDEHFEIGVNLSNQAYVLSQQGELDQAIALYQQVVELWTKLLGKSDVNYVEAVHDLGLAYRERGDFAKAETLLNEALDGARPLQFQAPVLYANALYNLATLYRQRGNYLRATPLLQAAIQQSEKVYGEGDANIGLLQNELGALHHDQNRLAEAVPHYERAIAIYSQVEGEDSTNLATCLDNLGRLYYDDKNYDRAEPLLVQAHEIRRRVLGENDPDVLASLAHLADLYRAKGDFARAEPLLVESVDKCRRSEGITSATYTSRLLELARLYEATERGDQGKKLRAAALAAIEQGLADQDAERLARRLNSYADTLNALAIDYEAADDLASVIQARRLRLDVLERLFGKDPWQVVDARLELQETERRSKLTAEQRQELAAADELFNQSVELEEQGRLREALAPVEEALAIRRRLVGDEDRFSIAALERLSSLHSDLAEYAAAATELNEALRLRRLVVGELHPNSLADMSSLGILSRRMGDFALAEEMYQTVLTRYLEVYGETSTEVASAMNNLAVLYEDMGRPSRALPLARRAVEIHTQLQGEEHLDTINALNTLGAVYLRMEDFNRAGPIFIRVTKLYKQLLGENHPDYVESVHTLATICADANLYDWAERFFTEAIAGREKTVGKQHPDYARTLNGLALLHWNQDKIDQAIAEHEEVLEIRLRTLGPRHTLTAQTQSSLARAYLEQGRLAEAERLLQAALETRRAVLDPTSPHIGSTLYGLALLYLATDRRDEARAALEESIALDQAQLEGVAAFASEPSLREFLNSIGYKYDRLMALAAADPADQKTARAALDWTLRRKAVILDTLCEYRAAESIFRHDREIADRIQEVKRKRQQAIDLALSPPAGMAPDQVVQQQSNLRDQARDLEEGIRAEINRRRLNQARPEVTLATVAASLPAGSALIEYIRFPTYDFKSWDERRELGDHYGAFVIAPGATDATFVDLGPAAAIDTAVAEVRQQIEAAPRELRLSSEADLEADYAVAARRLAELVFDPLRASLGKATTLYIAPDRELNRVPFAALVATDGRYLLDDFDLAYLSCGRDLLQSPAKVGDGTLVFAGPDYDLATPARAAKAEEMLAEADAPLEIQLAERSAPVEVDLRALRWNRLPGAEGEADDVGKALAGSDYAPVSLYVGANALEDVFKASHSPRILHIATHGFFLTASEQGPGSIERGPGDSAEAGAGAAGGIARLRLNANPLLRSGIVLAGANDLATDQATATTVEDGWVTAEEISLLDFRGTELVVLSACESGLGDIDTRDGVYGLRRAFFHAGAHNLLTSLFKVPDAETRRLMAAFYGKLAEGETKLAALHAAQRKILAERRSEGKAAHPFFWASFIMVGEGE